MTPEKLAERLTVWKMLIHEGVWTDEDAEALDQLRAMLKEPTSLVGHNEQVDLDGNIYRHGGNMTPEKLREWLVGIEKDFAWSIGKRDMEALAQLRAMLDARDIRDIKEKIDDDDIEDALEALWKITGYLMVLGRPIKEWLVAFLRSKGITVTP